MCQLSKVQPTASSGSTAAILRNKLAFFFKETQSSLNAFRGWSSKNPTNLVV